MKKTKKPKLIRVSQTPPTGWPTEPQWKEIEKKLSKGLATKMLSPDAGPVERTKHDLCEQFVLYRREAGITQRELAKRLDVTENRVSEILHYHFDTFTLDRLIELLSRIRPNLKIKVA